jgi:hypothetical protein
MMWLAVCAGVLVALVATFFVLIAWGTRRSGPHRHLQLKVGRLQLFHFDRGPGWCRFGLGRDILPRGGPGLPPAGDWPPEDGVREPRRPRGPGPIAGSISLDPPS